MKFLALSTLPLFIALFTTSKALDCPETQVPSSKHICIQPQYIEGCKIYESAHSCSSCHQGYHFNNQRCDFLDNGEADLSLVGCLQKLNGSCINCANGFKNQNGKCLKGVKNCKEYNKDMLCKECQADFSLITDQCRHNVILGCKKQNTDHTCSQCWPPFILNGQHCDIPDCMSLNDYGCTTCECGYYLTSQRNCKQMQNGCMRYERNRCVDCLPHYKLKGGACEIDGCSKYENHFCTQCKQNYKLMNGSCQFQNCFDWAQDSCIVCKQGFKVSSGLCVEASNLICE